jgi:hypothetical protein
MNENHVETLHATSLHCVHSNGFDITHLNCILGSEVRGDTKSVLITPLFSKRRGDGEKLAAEVEKGVYEADLV